MKKIICLLLAVVTAVALAACAKKQEPSSTAPVTETTTVTAPETQAASDAPTDQAAPATEGTVEAAMIPGKLNFIDLEDRDPSVLRGLSIAGNRAGTSEFNAKDPATEGIRCIFMLNEWVELCPDADEDKTFVVWVLKHTEDQKSYETAEFSEEMPGFAAVCELAFEPDDDPGWPWGSFYLNPEEVEPGYFDLVFTCEGKAIATLLTRFYADTELDMKSDEELAQIMTGLVSQ